MPKVYSRERLLSLRSRAAVSLLSRQQCLLISHLGLRRRGCRGGQHRHCRSQAVNTRVTSSMGIPTALVNKDQLIDGGRSIQHVETVLLPASPMPSPVLLRLDVTPQQSHSEPQLPEIFLSSSLASFADDDDDDDIHSATSLKQTLSPASVLSVRSDPELTSSPESLLSDYCINNLFDDAITCQDSLETELAVQAQPG